MAAPWSPQIAPSSPGDLGDTGATGVLADGSRAPPLPPLPPPPPSQHRTTKPEPVSRYRTLRGKSVSSVRGNKSSAFDVFCDSTSDNAEETSKSPTGTRRRSLSATSRRGFNALAARKAKLKRQEQQTGSPSPAPTAKLALATKSVNVSTPASPNLSEKSKPFRVLHGARSLNLAKFRDPNPSPPVPEKNPAAAQLDSETKKQTTKRQEREDAVRWADEVARLEAETDRILAEQKKRDLARLQAQLAGTPSPKPKLKPQRLIIDKLGFLARGVHKSSPSPSSPPTTPKTAPPRIISFDWPLLSPSVTESPSAPESPSPIDMSYLQYSQVDAPASAINGGERRVTVRCLESTINLAVTAETSPRDIANATAGAVTHNFNPANTVLIECFESMGLERRLRRYERIRDVMNSWGQDKENSLLVVAYRLPQENADLTWDPATKSSQPPPGFTFELYHSSHKGKWTKRWITLMDNGQIYAAKRPDAKSNDKDSTILCHLSDFDIYSPGPRELKREMKPPKPFCYTIKSQQKTSLFPTGENYIHHFCTDEEPLAQRFHELVFGWRSWYLAMKNKVAQESIKSSSSLRRSGTTTTAKSSLSIHSSCRGRPSGESSQHSVKKFQPLIDMSQFDKPIDEFGKNEPQSKPSTETTRTQGESPASKSPVTSPSTPISPQNADGFVAGGLLGAEYEKLKNADKTDAKDADGPFTEGPSLLNGMSNSPTTPGKSEASPWLPSAVEHTAKSYTEWTPPPQRRPATADAATSRRDRSRPPHGGPPGPPPNLPEAFRRGQSQRLGAGRGVKPPHGGPLINHASGGTSSSKPMPMRSNSKASTHSQGPPSGRSRSHSTASNRSMGPRHRMADQPPVPPLPHRSIRRAPPAAPPPGPRNGRNAAGEPLINRVK